MGLSARAVEISLKKNRVSTHRQYQSAWKKFLDFLSDRSIDHARVTISLVLDFLASYREVGLKYRTLVVYRYALSWPHRLVLGLNLASDPGVEDISRV